MTVIDDDVAVLGRRAAGHVRTGKPVGGRRLRAADVFQRRVCTTACHWWTASRRTTITATRRPSCDHKDHDDHDDHDDSVHHTRTWRWFAGRARGWRACQSSAARVLCSGTRRTTRVTSSGAEKCRPWTTLSPRYIQYETRQRAQNCGVTVRECLPGRLLYYNIIVAPFGHFRGGDYNNSDHVMSIKILLLLLYKRNACWKVGNRFCRSYN